MRTDKTNDDNRGTPASPDGLPSSSSASSSSSKSSATSPPAHYTQDDLLPLSALQHYLYCRRQCALIHIEQVWDENVFTAKGRILHDRTDTGKATFENGVKVARSMQVASRELGVYGVCDVVEFREGKPVPVEYKRGKLKAHRADEVQLCAQAMCLEEMFDTTITSADLFYGQPKRRTEVALDDELRDLTRQTAHECHAFIDAGQTPRAEYSRQLCSACSLLDICLPVRKKQRKSVERYLADNSDQGENAEK